MNSSDEMLKLLTEIRDVQAEHLAEYKRVAARSLEIQEESVQRQAAVVVLYKRVLAICGALIAGIVVLLALLVSGGL